MNCKINFANIVNNHDCIILKDRVLSCAEKSRRFSETEINPASKIMFISHF